MDKHEQLIDIMEEAAKGETKATLRARIAELEAEVERLTKNLYLTRNERDNLSDNVTRLESEALSRTGAVNALPERAPYEILQVLGREYETSGEMWTALRSALSALEPAAQEGFCYRDENGQVQFQQVAPESQQEAAEADRIRREMEEILRRQSERDIPFAPATRPGGRT